MAARTRLDDRRVETRSDAVTALTVYLVLLLAVPSSATITALGSVGRPATLWGLACAVWWAWTRLQDLRVVHRGGPIPTALLSFLVVVLMSYAAAQFRGIPFTEQSPADGGLLRLASWSGVLLIGVHGIGTQGRLHTLVRRVVTAGSAVAALGLAQFATGAPLVPPVDAIPGFSVDTSLAAVQVRSGLTRSAATASHPLEYASVLAAVLPLAVTIALTSPRRTPLKWIPTGLLALASVVAVSRSAIVGVIIGLVVLSPTWSRRARLGAAAATAALLGVVFVAAPGVLGTLRGLFLGVGTDPSTDSRTGGYGTAADIAQHHLWLGRGFGTFLPQYWIFDNQYLQLLIEVGVLGVVAFIGLIMTAVLLAYSSRQWRYQPGRHALGPALAASAVAVAVLYAFFGALSFPMAGGVLFLLLGMCGAAARLAARQPIMRHDGEMPRSRSTVL